MSSIIILDNPPSAGKNLQIIDIKKVKKSRNIALTDNMSKIAL